MAQLSNNHLAQSLTFAVILGSGCSTGSGGWNCCSNSNQCNIGEGDCDIDSHCSGNLECGTNNCGSNFPTGFDCCILPTIGPTIGTIAPSPKK